MIWYLMQVILVLIFILGIYNLIIKKVKIGFIQIISSVIIFVYNFLFIMHRDWVNGNQTPQDYFIKRLPRFDINSIIILISFLTLLVFTVKHIRNKNYK